MPGSATRSAASPRPLELLARLLIAGALVLWSAHLVERSLVQRMLPAFNRIIPLVDDEFTILTTDITQDGANESIRFRLNLSRPIAVGGQTIYPFGWGPIPPGGFQVAIVLGGVLQYCLLLAILIFAWPVKRLQEYGLRVAIAVPLLAVLLFIDVPFTVLAELWGVIHAQADPGALQPLMIWSRFLMGGGGLALGILFGGLAIAVAGRTMQLKP